MIQFEKGRIVPSTKRLFSSRWKFIPFIKHNGAYVTVVAASGFLEKGDAFRIRQIVDENLKEGIAHFIVNFSEVNHMHYSNVPLLVGLKEMVEQSSGEVKFVVRAPYLIDILFFAGWPCVDDVYPTEESAMNSFKEHSRVWRERVQSTYSGSCEGND
jgi:anti-anti-sigma regulatory factor